MSVYKRGENWYIDFTFHGHRVREMIGPSRKGADKVIAKRKTEIAENKYLDKRKELEPIKFHDFSVQYLQWAKANKAKNSYNRDLTSMRHLNKEFENRNIHEITLEEVEGYYSKRKEISIYSANRELALLKHFYRKATEWKKVKENPTKEVKVRLKEEVQRIRFLMPNEIQILLSCCPDNLKPIVTVALHTGMRREEILSLKWTQVNLLTGIIHLDKTKNHESRNIKMNVTVRSALSQIEHRSEFVFCKPDGSRYSQLPGPFEDVVKKAGIEDFHFHDLRHTFASTLVMAGKDILVVQKLLGHKKLDMTLRYAHLAPNYGDAVNILDGIFTPIEAEKEGELSLNPPQEKIALNGVTASA
jgi:site-specific recombinase XerD